MLAAYFVLALVIGGRPAQAAAPQKKFDEIAKKASQARSADRIGEAIALYSEGVKLRPSWQEGWWWLGSLLYEADRFAEAQTVFKHFVAISPKKGPAYAFLALCEYETKSFDQSLQHFKEWARLGSPGNDALLDVAGYHWALLLTRSGEFVEALYLLDAKVVKLGRNPVLVEALGLASLRLHELPETYPPEKRDLVWKAGEAAAYATLQRFPRAEESADQLLLHYDRAPNVHFLRGTLYGFQKKNSEAIEEYRRELEIFPDNAPAMVELASVLLEEGEAEKALPLAARASALEPKNPRAHYALGRALLAGGQSRESAVEFEAAKLLAPKSASVRYNLAKAYRAAGRQREADEELTVFRALRRLEDAVGGPPGGGEKSKRPQESKP